MKDVFSCRTRQQRRNRVQIGDKGILTRLFLGCICIVFGLVSASVCLADRDESVDTAQTRAIPAILMAAGASLLETWGGKIVGDLWKKSEKTKNAGRLKNFMGAINIAHGVNVTSGEPLKQYLMDATNVANYALLHVGVLRLAKDGSMREMPMNTRFRSGDRIKLRIMSSFDGMAVIENLSPDGKRAVIFPGSPDQVVEIRRYVGTVLPASDDQWFEFEGDTGDEEVRITVRHEKAFGRDEDKGKVFQKHLGNGTAFAQELMSGKYPVISQSIRITHE